MSDLLNAWGEPVDPDKVSPAYQVPKDERVDFDEGPDSNALGDGTDNDLDGWTPEDGLE